MKSKFENSAKVTGIVKSSEFDGTTGSGLGKIKINGDDSTLYVQMWEKTDKNGEPLGIVKRFLAGVHEDEKYTIRGELNERLWEGEYKREIENRMISAKKKKVYNVFEADEEEKEVANVKLGGDIIESDLTFTREVRGETVEEEKAKYTATLAVFNQYNPELGKEDENMSRHDILALELKNKVEYGDVDNQKYKKWIQELESGCDMGRLYDILLAYDGDIKNMSKISLFHLVAYGDKAEDLAKEADKGVNVLVGCDINTRMIINEYDIVEGSLNELEIMFHRVNERVYKEEVNNSW